MPFGYLISTVVVAVVVVLALRPRPTRGPRATPAFVIESVANELPFTVFYWLVATTLLAAVQGDLTTPVGLLGLGVALLTTGGLIAVVRRARAARATLERALADALGPGWPPRLERKRMPWRQISIAPLHLTPRTVQRTRNVAYGPEGQFNRLDLYRSRAQRIAGPAFVYFHPGGFGSGRKSREARPLLERLASKGWVCLSANYRLGQEGLFPRSLVDAKRVIAWARAHADELGADDQTVFVAGGSAGAHLAAMCALTANDVAFQPGIEAADTSVTAAIGLYGYYGPAPAEPGMRSSPTQYASDDAPPFLVIHGAIDPMVPPEGAREFVSALRAENRQPVVYAELPGGQHNFDRFASIRFAAVIDAIEAFAAWVRSSR
jgi:acetyl esterase/lipase